MNKHQLQRSAWPIPLRLMMRVNELLSTEDPSPKVAQLAELHSLRATKVYDRAAGLVAEWAEELGLAVKVEDFPADGKQEYGAFLSEPAWDVNNAILRMLEPDQRILADWSTTPIALVWYSQAVNVTSELVYVGSGTQANDYQDQNVQGRIVLADGPHRQVHEQAVYKRGSLGVVSGWHLFGERHPDVCSSDGYGIRPWTGRQGQPPGFIFSIPYGVFQSLRDRLLVGNRIKVEAIIEAETYSHHYRIVSALLPGSITPDQEIVLTAHLDATAPGACHNASAVLALLQTASLIQQLDGWPGPSRSIRFLWTAEHRGTVAYLRRHPEWKENIIAGINVDLAGASTRLTGAVTSMNRSPDSQPAFTDDLFAHLLRWVAQTNTADFSHFPERFSYPIVSPFGSEDNFCSQVTEFKGMSDHVQFISAGVPMTSFSTWPFEFLGTSGDTIDVFDPTQFKRLCFILSTGLYYLAASGPQQFADLAGLVFKEALNRLNQFAFSLPHQTDTAVPDQERREFIRWAGEAGRWKLDRELRMFDQMGRLLATTKTDHKCVKRLRDNLIKRHRQNLSMFLGVASDSSGKYPAQKLSAESCNSASFADWIPERLDVNSGQINRQYLEANLGRPLRPEESEVFDHHPYTDFEIINFIDGHRTVDDLRQALGAEFAPIPLINVFHFLNALEQAQVIRWIRAGNS